MEVGESTRFGTMSKYANFASSLPMSGEGTVIILMPFLLEDVFAAPRSTLIARANVPSRPCARPIAPRLKPDLSEWRDMAGSAQPSPTIAQCLNGGLGWLEVE